MINLKETVAHLASNDPNLVYQANLFFHYLKEANPEIYSQILEKLKSITTDNPSNLLLKCLGL
jgi:hypothetical protein